jgi:glycosyltransferase involved in cell wall biosynthesis
MNLEQTKLPHITIVSPVYSAANIVPELVNRIDLALSKITDNYEIILVEDCGPDNSWEVIQEIAKTNLRVKGFKLSKNFGQHYAITCGLDHAKGDWIVVMDCDLQDQPEEIVKLYQKTFDGYDVVLAQRVIRQDKFVKRLFSKLFYRILGYLTGSKLDSSIANFGIYNQKVIQSLILMRESIRYFPTMVKWVGFRQTAIPIEHSQRSEGKTSYNFKRLFNLALDIMLAYSDKPIRLMIRFGLIISLASFFMGFVFLMKYLFGEVTVQGYTSLIISTWFFSGLILIMIGVVGLYVGKTFEGVKRRPIYIIQLSTI